MKKITKTKEELLQEIAKLKKVYKKDISQLKKTEEELRKSEEKYRTLVQYSNDPIFTFNPDETYRFVNEAFAKPFGKTPEEIIGKTPHSLFPKDEAERRLKLVRKVFKTGEGGEIEVKVVTKSGDEKYYLTIVDPIKDEKGNILWVSCISKDITERKKMEYALQESNSKFLSFASNVPSHVAYVNSDTLRYEFVNNLFEKSFGIPKEKIIGSHIKEIIGETNFQFALNYIEQVKLGKPISYQNTFDLVSGKRWMHVNYAPITDAQGRIVSIAVHSHDITELKQTEEALIESENNLREANKIAAIGNWELNLITSKLKWSDGIFDIFEIDKNKFEATYEAFLDAIYPDDRERVNTAYTESLTNKTPYEISHRLLMHDGRIKWVNEICRTEYDIQGKPIRSFGIVQDITKQKQNEEALIQSSEIVLLAATAGGVGIWELDIVNNKLTWDDQMFRLYGIAQDSFGGAYETWKAGVHPEDLTRSDAEVQMALRGKKEFDTEFRVVWPDRTIHYIKARAQVHRDQSGQPIKMIGTNYDITERKLVEENLSNERTLLKNIIENIPIPVYVKDLQGRKILANQAEAFYAGKKTIDEIIGKTNFELYSYEVAERSRLEEEAIIKSGKSIRDFEVSFISDDGKKNWYIGNKVLLKDSKGNPSGILSVNLDITERKHAEIALQLSESKLKAITDNVADTIIQSNRSGQITYINKLQPGMTYEQVLSSTVFDFVPPEQKLIVEKALDSVFINGETNEYETLGPGFEGKWSAYEVRVSPIFIGDQVDSAVFLARDVTERKLAEKSLRESEDRYHQLFTTSPAPMIVHQKGIIIEVNDAALQLFGTSNAIEVIGTPVLDRVHPDYRSIVIKRVNDISEKNIKAPLIEEKLLGLDGSEIDAEVTASQVYLRGEPAVQIVLQNITDRKLSEKTLKESESRYRALYNNTPVMMHSIDSQGNLINVSEYWLDNLGYTRDEVIGRKSTEFLSEISRKYAKEIVLPEFMKRGYCNNIEYQFVKKNGEVIDTLLSAISEKDENGMVTRSLAVTTDITSRKQAEEALQKSEERYRSLFEDSPIAIWEEDFSSIKQHFEKLRQSGISDFRAYWKNHPEEILNLSAMVKIISINEASVTILDAEYKEQVFLDMTKYFTYGSLKVFKEELIALASGEMRFHSEISLNNVKGEPVIFDLYLAVQPGFENDLSRVLVSFIDITYRKKAEEELSLSKQQLELAQRSAGAGLWDWNMISQKLDWSNELYQLFGLDPNLDEATLDVWEKLIHPDDREKATRHLQNAIEEKIPLVNEYRVIHPTGKIRWISALGNTNYDQSGRPVRMAGICIDITEQKIVEQAIVESEEKLRALTARLEKVREEERTNLSRDLHDNLGQNLTALKMDVTYLAKKVQTIKSFDSEDLLLKTSAMLKLIDDMINIVRKISTELRPNVLDYLGLVPAIEWLIGEFKSRTEIDCELKSNIKIIDLGEQINSSIFRIIQEAFTNIIRHSGATKVIVSIEEDDDLINLEILDNGSGIKEADISNVLSLGIIGMKERTLQFNGKLHLENAPQGGTLLTLIIPKG